MSAASEDPRGEARQQGIAVAITEVSERATLLIREEIELAKTEIVEKGTRLAKGAVVAIVAGAFLLTALFFVLVGLAWLLYYELPIGNDFTYFWGFFAMAAILVVLGAIAGLLALKAVKSGSPPVPEMAIEEARKIRATVSGGSGSTVDVGAAAGAVATADVGAAAGAVATADVGAAADGGSHPEGHTQRTHSPWRGAGGRQAPVSGTHDDGLGRETEDGSTLGR